jgi:hypothetical protein
MRSSRWAGESSARRLRGLTKTFEGPADRYDQRSTRSGGTAVSELLAPTVARSVFELRKARATGSGSLLAASVLQRLRPGAVVESVSSPPRLSQRRHFTQMTNTILTKMSPNTIRSEIENPPSMFFSRKSSPWRCPETDDAAHEVSTQIKRCTRLPAESES